MTPGVRWHVVEDVACPGKRAAPRRRRRALVGRLLSIGLMVLAGGCAAPVGSGADGAEYVGSILQWRSERLARLQSREGWLGYIGSGKLLPGQYRVGSATDNDLVLPSGPTVLGTLVLTAAGDVSVDFAADADAVVDGATGEHGVLARGDAEWSRSAVVNVGTGQFYLVRTGTVFGWRFRQTDPAQRPPMGRMEHYPIDPAWRVKAHWEVFAQPEHVTLLTSNGTPTPARVPGQATFTLRGQQYRLRPVLLDEGEGGPQLFFLFTDRTSGRKSYGGGRYLFAPVPEGDQVVLDFNRAQNPPCAITAHVVCPLAPRVNRLELAVTAGEQTYLPGN